MLRRIIYQSNSKFVSPVLVGLLLLVLMIILSTNMIVVAAQAPPSVTVVPDKAQVETGELVTFRLAYVLPEGYDLNQPIDILLTWTANATLEEPSGASGFDPNGPSLTLSYPTDLPPSGDLPTFTLKAGDTPGSLEVTATISSPSQADATLQSVEGTTSVTVVEPAEEQVTAEPPQADLSQSTLDLDPSDKVVAGEQINIEVVVTNSGSAPAEDVTVTITPNPRIDSLTPTSSVEGVLSGPLDNGSFTVQLSDAIAPSSSSSLQLRGTVATDAKEELTIKVLITAAGEIEYEMEKTVSVEQPARPKLAVEIGASDSAVTGDTLDLLLRVINSSEVLAENVKVAVSTSPPVKLVVANGDITSAASTDANTVVVEIPRVDPGKQAEIKLTGVAPDGSTLLINADLQEPELYDSVSTNSPDLKIALEPQPTDTPSPTATPEPTKTPAPTKQPPTPTLTPTPEPPAGSILNSDTGGLLTIGIVALLAALVAGIVLFFLLRGRRKPTPPPVSTDEPGDEPPLPPPPPTAGAVLESVSMPGRQLRLGDGVTTIGRALDSMICINERFMNWETVSRHHAEIRREGDYYVICDVSKRNGVYVNGMRTARNVLRPECRVGIGGVEFIFHVVAAADQ